MRRWLDSLQLWGGLLLRLALGSAMLYHGWDKVFPTQGVHGHPLAAIDHFSHVVTSLGLPPWLGYISALTEFFGGILLILGLLSRFAALFVSINMAVAIVIADRHRGYSGSEYAIALLVVALMLLFYGPGAFALDRRFGLA